MTHPAETDEPQEEFLSSCKEWHAFFWGVYKGLHPGRGRYEYRDEPDYVQVEIRSEWHYYTLGFIIGRASYAGLALALKHLGVI